MNFVQLDLVDVDDGLIRQAAGLAEAQALRYDAVHLAAALQVIEPVLVLVAGDRALPTWMRPSPVEQPLSMFPIRRRSGAPSLGRQPSSAT